MQIYLPFLAAALYILSVVLQGRWLGLANGIAAIAWLVHGAALWLTIFPDQALRVGFAVMLSAALWISVLVCWLENRQSTLDGLRLLLMPNAAAMALLPSFFPGSLITLAGKTAMFPWHVLVALLAYSTLTIAAFHAVVMTVQDKHLHQLRGTRRAQWLTSLLDKLPALLTMEKILFRFVLFGFVLLTLTVLSGVIFSEQVLGVAFKWDHKTMLSLLSWLLFAILLTGRYRQGWRGKTVLSFTLSGFVALLLAYVGSRFVLEVLLHRSLT